MLPQTAPPSSTRLRRLFGRYVAFAGRRTGVLLVALGLLAALSLSVAVRLGLDTDMAELLPNQHPGVIALHRLAGRQKTSTNLVLLVSSPDRGATERFAAALEPALTSLVPRVFNEVQWRPDDEIPDHARRWRWLYADLRDLESAESLLDRVIAGRSGMVVDLDGDPEVELKALRQRLDRKLPGASAPQFEMQRNGRFYRGVVLWRRGTGLASLGDHESMAATRNVVEALHPRSFHPGLTVEYTGNIAMAIDEGQAVRDDLTVATGVCATLVLLSIYLYFRRVALIWVVGSPAVLGLLLALAVARFAVGNLNANTAFLLSIILGNGINFPIMLLARYGEERRRGRGVDESLRDAMSATALGTGTAMLAAAVAYGSLLATSLRGFNQFGLVGGTGMLAAWTSTFLLVPPMVFFGERRWPGSLTPRPAAVIWRRPFQWLGSLAQRHPSAPAIAALGLALVAAMPLRNYLRDPFEWDFSKLRTSDTSASERWTRMFQIGIGPIVAGYIAQDGIILVDRPDQADAVAEALRRQDAPLGPRQHLIKEVRTLNSVLPADQDEKLELLARVRRKIDRHRDMMSEDERREAEAWRPPDYLRRITADDLPRRIRDAFTEVDGVRGRMVGIDAESKNIVDNDGHDLLRVARAMEVEALGKKWVAASPSTIFAGMLEVIVKDGPRVTLYALVGVVLLVFVAFGWRGALPVLASLAIGLVWLAGLAAGFRLRLNFLNFVALPITLGVAADYAANVWARLRGEGRSQLASVITETGSAVALCSATTVIGYSSLLLAHNGALRSFGLLADIGEVTCLWSALFVLPAIAARLRRPAAAAAVKAA